MAEVGEWEYRVISYGGALRGPKDEELEAELNALGADGWEVVSAIPRENTNKVTVVARRPLTTGARRRRTAPESSW